MSRTNGLLVTLVALALMIWVMVQFSIIWATGSVTVFENNYSIRVIETVLFVVMTGVLLRILVKVYKSGKEVK